MAYGSERSMGNKRVIVYCHRKALRYQWKPGSDTIFSPSPDGDNRYDHDAIFTI